MNEYLNQINDQYLFALFEEHFLVERLEIICHILQKNDKLLIEEQTGIFVKELNELNKVLMYQTMNGDGIHLPTNSSVLVSELLVDECTFKIKMFRCELILKFISNQIDERQQSPLPIIIKFSKCLRKDFRYLMVGNQIFHCLNQLWLESGLDLMMKPNKFLYLHCIVCVLFCSLE